MPLSQKPGTFAISFLYGKCSSLKFRWAICPTVSKAEGTIIPCGSKTSKTCKMQIPHFCKIHQLLVHIHDSSNYNLTTQHSSQQMNAKVNRNKAKDSPSISHPTIHDSSTYDIFKYGTYLIQEGYIVWAMASDDADFSCAKQLMPSSGC
ncbi:hypothetical protein H5410_059927 [Solanum commersonii]|uniref:Uncharacterized protein n=1 Tax=Solanum commersonii TaxID=4109 RepID=A0A9J5W440_SOLCO|nr:hypothetical protein H5410_059927 [Solanum commersonii]